MVDKTTASPAKKKLTLKNTGLLVGSTKKPVNQSTGEGNDSIKNNQYNKVRMNNRIIDHFYFGYAFNTIKCTTSR